MKQNVLRLDIKLNVRLSNSGVGKLRPAGHLRPAKEKSAAREYVICLNGMRPAKENFAAREHVNVARRAKRIVRNFFL